MHSTSGTAKQATCGSAVRARPATAVPPVPRRARNSTAQPERHGEEQALGRREVGEADQQTGPRVPRSARLRPVASAADTTHQTADEHEHQVLGLGPGAPVHEARRQAGAERGHPGGGGTRRPGRRRAVPAAPAGTTSSALDSAVSTTVPVWGSSKTLSGQAQQQRARTAGSAARAARRARTRRPRPATCPSGGRRSRRWSGRRRSG